MMDLFSHTLIAAGGGGEHADMLFGFGIALLAMALLVKLGGRIGLPVIPFVIIAGLIIGPHSPGPVLIERSDDIYMLATLGLIFLLFHLGLEFSVDDLQAGGRKLLWAGGSYVVLNIGMGLVFGAIVDWGWREMIVLAGMLGTSSTAIVTKLLVELGRIGNRESGMILGVIVFEDVFLAFYLALLQPVLLGETDPVKITTSIAIALGFLLGLFALARWGGRAVGRLIGSEDDERLTLLFVGFAVFIAGFAVFLGASDAIGALLAGMVVAGTDYARRVERLVQPLRDMLAAVFFLWFGTTIVPDDLSNVLGPVIIAILLSLVFNVIAGSVAARIYGYGRSAAMNAATLLVSRGEFELVLASLAIAAGLDSRVAPFAALYVFALAILSPLLATQSDKMAHWLPIRWFPADVLARERELQREAAGAVDR